MYKMNQLMKNKKKMVSDIPGALQPISHLSLSLIVPPLHHSSIRCGWITLVELLWTCDTTPHGRQYNDSRL
jgi:hypothetical protein